MRIRTRLLVLMTGSLKEMVYRQDGADIEAELIFKSFKLSDFLGRVVALLEDLPCHKFRTA